MIGYHGSEQTLTHIHAGTGMGLYLATTHDDAAAYGPLVHTLALADTARIADQQHIDDAVEATRWIDEDAGIALYDPADYSAWALLEMNEVRDHLAEAGFDGVELDDVTPEGADHQAVLVWNTRHLTITHINDTRRKP